jgi:hypothetical protein
MMSEPVVLATSLSMKDIMDAFIRAMGRQPTGPEISELRAKVGNGIVQVVKAYALIQVSD